MPACTGHVRCVLCDGCAAFRLCVLVEGLTCSHVYVCGGQWQLSSGFGVAVLKFLFYLFETLFVCTDVDENGQRLCLEQVAADMHVGASCRTCALFSSLFNNYTCTLLYPSWTGHVAEQPRPFLPSPLPPRDIRTPCGRITVILPMTLVECNKMPTFADKKFFWGGVGRGGGGTAVALPYKSTVRLTNQLVGYKSVRV